jgi:type III restriction enzyme
LQLEGMRFQALSDELWMQYLRTGGVEALVLGSGGVDEVRLEDYVVSGLVDFDDVSYEGHADLLYELAGQVVLHLRSYLTEEQARRVLRTHQKQIAQFVHAQMQKHYWEDDGGGYDVQISKGYTELRPSAYTHAVKEAPADYRDSPADKSNMSKYLFTGFERCLYSVQKFDSEAERKLAVILDRDALKWFKPAKGQFQIFYRQGADHLEYQPDFVAETKDAIYMLEPKKNKEMEDTIVLAKKESAMEWCANASTYALANGGKPWSYVLIPHDEIAGNFTLSGLVARFGG